MLNVTYPAAEYLDQILAQNEAPVAVVGRLVLKGDEISLQARILGLVDIFESLTADDRPYRAKPLSREIVLKILREMVDDNHLDREVHEVFQHGDLFDKLDEIKAQMVRERVKAR